MHVKQPLGIIILSDFAFPIKGGTERHIDGLANFLGKNKFRVIVLEPNWRNEAQFVQREFFEIHRFSGPFLRNGAIRIFYYLCALLKKNPGFKADVFHGFYTFPVVAATVIGSKLSRTRSIVTLFEPEPIEYHLKHPVAGFFAKKILLLADFITTLNYSLESEVKGFLKTKKIKTVTNWIEDYFFMEAKKFPKRTFTRSGKKKILFVGRLEHQKGVMTLIEALPLLEKKMEVMLEFVGPPNQLKECKRLAKRLGVDKSILFSGFKSEAELAKAYAECDVLVYPSLLKGGFGFTVIEAMAFSRPVVVSDDMGIPEAAGNAGLVSKKGDAVDLADKIYNVLSDKNLHEQLSKNALTRSKNFTEEKIISEYVEIYKSLLE